MIEEEHGKDIWQAQGPGDWVCVTTNCTVRKDGKLVMGGGIALEAAQRHPWLPKAMGEAVQRKGASIEVFKGPRLIAFPVKNDVKAPAILGLIEAMAQQLASMVRYRPFIYFGVPPKRVLIPQPGCGLGALNWQDVKPVLAQYFTGNQYVIFSK